jgi:glutaredoxin
MCGLYDTDDFVASSMCCQCKWTDLSTYASSFNPEDSQSIFEDNFAVFFTKDNCEYCHEAINFMNSIGYSSLVVDFDTLDNRAAAMQYIQDHVGNKMVPALFINK